MVMGNENCAVNSSSDDTNTSKISKDSNVAAAGYHCCLQSSLLPNAVRPEVKGYHLLTLTREPLLPTDIYSGNTISNAPKRRETTRFIAS